MTQRLRQMLRSPKALAGLAAVAKLSWVKRQVHSVVGGKQIPTRQARPNFFGAAPICLCGRVIGTSPILVRPPFLNTCSPPSEVCTSQQLFCNLQPTAFRVWRTLQTHPIPDYFFLDKNSSDRESFTLHLSAPWDTADLRCSAPRLGNYPLRLTALTQQISPTTYSAACP